MKSKSLKLNDIFTSWLIPRTGYITGGFFANLYSWAALNEIEIPFLPDSDTARMLDYEYHGNNSGNKIISPLLVNLIYPDDKLTNETVKMLVSAFWAIHGENCAKQFELLSLEFNPIENYSMIESGEDATTGTDTVSDSGKDTVTNSGKDTVTDSGTDTVSDSGTDTVTDSGTDTVSDSGTDTKRHGGKDSDKTINATDVSEISAFDSSDFEDADKTTTNGTVDKEYNSHETFEHGKETETTYGKETETEYGKKTETEYGKETETEYGKKTETEYGKETETEYGKTITHSLTRSGNIGVTTSQQMIQSSIELWQWNFYKNFLFPVVDMVCTIPIY